MKADIKLDGNKWNRNVEIKKINEEASSKIDRKILVKAKDLYPAVPLYKSGRIFLIMYLKCIVGSVERIGFVICPCNYGESHLHYVKNIYWYKNK